MIELLQEYWKAFCSADGYSITGLAMTLWLLGGVHLASAFILSVPLAIARVSTSTSASAGRCSSIPTCFAARRCMSSC